MDFTFLRPYLRRHFHCVAIDRDSRPSEAFAVGAADRRCGTIRLVGSVDRHFLNRALFPRRHFFAPIDADVLQQYRVFEKLGFYGVKLSSTSARHRF